MKSKKVKKLLRKYCDFWVTWLGLKWWRVEIVFERGRTAARDGEADKAGECFADWMYLRAKIQFWPDVMTHLTKSEIEKVAIHELAHVLVNEMRAEGIDHEERVVTGLEYAFKWVRDATKEGTWPN